MKEKEKNHIQNKHAYIHIHTKRFSLNHIELMKNIGFVIVIIE
jgi:hypothetical protein